MLCEVMSAAALLISLIALFQSKRVTLEVVEKKLAKKREKVRKRYVLVATVTHEPEKVEKECLDEAVKSAVRELYGTIGLALSKPKVVYVDEVTKAAVVRTTLEGVKILASALIGPREACGTTVNLIPLRAFGTLASAREKLPKLNKYVKDLK